MRRWSDHERLEVPTQIFLLQLSSHLFSIQWNNIDTLEELWVYWRQLTWNQEISLVCMTIYLRILWEIGSIQTESWNIHTRDVYNLTLSLLNLLNIVQCLNFTLPWKKNLHSLEEDEDDMTTSLCRLHPTIIQRNHHRSNSTNS